MDVSRLTALGWKAKTTLREGIEKTYAAYLAEKAAGTLRCRPDTTLHSNVS